MLAAVIKESDASRGQPCGVEVFTVIEQLEVDQIACPFAPRAGDGMDFLRDLMVGPYHRHGPGRVETHLREKIDQAGKKQVLGFAGAPS